MDYQLTDIPNISELDFERVAAGSYGKIDLAKYNEGYAAVKWLNDSYFKSKCREAQILNDCKDKNILRLYGAGPDVENHNLKYLLCEWAPNGDLKKVIQNKLSYNIWHIVLWCAHITSGLRYLHTHTQKIILHRDIKPHNMLLFNKCTLLKIADFGSSRYGKEDLSQPISTEGYAPPEIKGINYDYDETVDIYSFGMTLKCLLMRNHNLYYTANVSEYSPFLTKLIARCTSNERSNRPSAVQLAQIFDLALRKIYADDIKKLELETRYCNPCEDEDEPEIMDLTGFQDTTIVPGGRPLSFDLKELPRHLRPCYINESKNASAYQKYIDHAKNYLEQKKGVESVQKQIDDILNQIIEKLQVQDSDQDRAKQMLLTYAEMETERTRRNKLDL
nr:mitogen activated protein kinase kinase kinase 7 [Hymenolepis microstoma]